ncbi:MAG: ABC transporter permease [Clostridia bacterium]|nr:ABC transporter permease [Clostridia bacterium]
MSRYILKRLILAVLTLLVIVFVLFLMLQYMPGSPFNDEKLNAEQVAALKSKYGLDQPVYIRFFKYVSHMVRGDFGLSYNIQKNVPISSMIRGRLPVSIRLGAQAVLLGTLLGLVLGVMAALWHNTFVDTLCTIVSVVGVSVPSFVFAFFLLYNLGFKAGLFPILYKVTLPVSSTVLPTLALSMFPLAQIARFSRTEMLEVLGSDYMLFAESKGLTSFRLHAVHALRNVLIPIITVLAPLIVSLMTGSMVIEKIFSVPGVGSLLVTAIQSNDYNVVVSLTFIYCVMYIGIMLVVDMLYGVIDPRIRLTKENSHEG